MKKQKLRWGRVLAVGALFATLVGGVLVGCTDPISEEILTEKEVALIAEADFTEADLQQYLHEITHGFVKAEKKWGEKRELNEVAIANLRTLINEYGKDFEHYDYYLTVLDEWENDYENMIDVHNFLWDEQGGTIGYAYEMMTESDIKNYYKKHFGVKEDYYLLDNGRGLNQGGKLKEELEKAKDAK